MQKNAANQKWQIFVFNRANNQPLTGDAANITANLRKDWGTASPTNDINPTEVEDGYYVFDMTQEETNADVLTLFPESTTSNIQVIAIPPMINTTQPDIGVGAITCNIYTKTVSGEPIDGVEVWITSDVDGNDIVAGTLVSDAMGLTTFYMDTGTYYVWRQRAGYTFTNPQTLSVT